MGKKLCILLACILVAGANSEDLGTIKVESSTISDLSTDQKTEVSTVNTIDEKTITKIDPKNINDLLQTIPGVTADVRSDIVEIHIRGVGQQEFMWEDTGVVIVIDGVPVMQDGGKVRGINIDEIESIKVIKGSASYLYGANALAGAIIITTKKYKNRNGGSFSSEFGSYGYQNYKAKFYKTTDKYAFDLMGGYKYEDGYWDQTQNDKVTASGKFTYFIDDMSDVAVSADYTKKYEETTRGSVTGVTEAQTNPTGADDGDWAWSKDYNMDIYKYYITYNKDFENQGNLKVNTYYYKDLYNYISSPRDLSGDGNDDTYTYSTDKNIKQYGLKSEYKNNINDLAYMLGVDIGKKEYESYRFRTVTYSSWGNYYYEGEGSTTTTTEKNYAIYGETKYKVNKKVTVTGNVRLDYNDNDYVSDVLDYNGTDWDNTTLIDDKGFPNLTYRLGATYDTNYNSTLYANVSTVFRNPRVEDLYAGDLKSSDYYTYVNNPDIDTETTITYEAGIRGKVKRGLSYEVSVFVTDTKDIIGKTGGTYYSGDEVYYDNVGDARNRGIEATLKGKLNEKMTFNIAYTYLDAYYTSHNPFYVALGASVYRGGTTADDAVYDITGNQLPRVPHHKIDLIVNYRFLPKWNLMTELYAQSKYYADETNFVTMPGYAKVNLRADYHYNKKLNFYLKVDNVLDKQYYRTVYLFSDRNYDGVLDAEDASITVDPGRVFYAGFKYKF
ncbi:MAG: TonB-dependent receptor [Campylobacteraceae bacterium]|nr:TonB-dependent receptor [Campylobacteraceae bacterium]